MKASDAAVPDAAFLEKVMRHQDGALSAEETAAFEDEMRHDANKRRLFAEAQLRSMALHERFRLEAFRVVAPAKRVTWFASLLSRPLWAAAAGIVFGMFGASLVYGFVVRQQTSVQVLLMEGFEDAAMPLDRGVPSRVDVWSGDLWAPVEAKDGVQPAEGRLMLVLRPDEGRTQCSAYRFLNLTSLPTAKAGESRRLEVTARFYGGNTGVRSRLRMRLTAFAEEAAEASQMFVNGSVPELALAHVEKSDRMKVEEWNTVRLAIDVPIEARVLLLSILAGLEKPSSPMPERHLDDVQVRLITQEVQLP